jgi:7-keto-8-aminopelargonate synthetase-like enzyme
LRARGFFVQPIRPPTVPDGTARLRITLSASHHAKDVDSLAHALTSLIIPR